MKNKNNCKICTKKIPVWKNSNAVYCSAKCKRSERNKKTSRIRRQRLIAGGNTGFQRIIIELLGSKCFRCSSGEGLEIDHIVAISLGGVHETKNIQVLCRECHKLKNREEISLRLKKHLYSPRVCQNCATIGASRQIRYIGVKGVKKLLCLTCHPKIKSFKGDRWALHFDACIECKKTIYPHQSRGVCRRCKQRLENYQEHIKPLQK